MLFCSNRQAKHGFRGQTEQFYSLFCSVIPLFAVVESISYIWETVN